MTSRSSLALVARGTHALAQAQSRFQWRCEQRFGSTLRFSGKRRYDRRLIQKGGNYASSLGPIGVAAALLLLPVATAGIAFRVHWLTFVYNFI